MKIRFALLVVVSVALLSTLRLVAPAADAKIHPLVDARFGYLLGGSRNGKWVSDKETAKAIMGREAYRVYGASTLLGNSTGSKTRTDEAPCNDTHWVTLKKNYNGVLALGANWNAAPRKVRAQNTTGSFYKREVARILRAHGIKKPTVKIAQLWRVDLEGDGRDEVLLSATNYGGERAGPKHISANAKAGEYSLVLLRKIVGGSTRTIVLAEEYYPAAKTFSAPNEHRLAGVLDANGDGKMEILLRSSYYEGDSISLLEIKGDKVHAPLSVGCGA